MPIRIQINQGGTADDALRETIAFLKNVHCDLFKVEEVYRVVHNEPREKNDITKAIECIEQLVTDVKNKYKNETNQRF